jgi:hypothetical protein
MGEAAIVMLFLGAFAASAWTLFASVAPQLHRFRALAIRPVALPPLPSRLSRVTVRAVPARMPARPQPRRAAA